MSHEREDHAEIDWAAAEVESAVLHVSYVGRPTRRWAQRVQDVLQLLQQEGHRGPWSSVKVSENDVEVAGIRPGTERDVRYVLEAAVREANADLAPRGGEARPGHSPDEDMTAAFRAFAGKPRRG
jgi:hypothetical protein